MDFEIGIDDFHVFSDFFFFCALFYLFEKHILLIIVTTKMAVIA